jgi:hypothetical protein
MGRCDNMCADAPRLGRGVPAFAGKRFYELLAIDDRSDHSGDWDADSIVNKWPPAS